MESSRHGNYDLIDLLDRFDCAPFLLVFVLLWLVALWCILMGALLVPPTHKLHINLRASENGWR